MAKTMDVLNLNRLNNHEADFNRCATADDDGQYRIGQIENNL